MTQGEPLLRADASLLALRFGREQTSTVVTGGEDGRVCLWSL